MPNSTNSAILSRYVQIDNWIFEVKAVRALRVDDYGKPYSAIANFTLNGNDVYIDGLLTRDQDDFTRKDYLTFMKMCQQLGVKNANFDRFKQKKRSSDTVKVPPVILSEPQLRLVK